MPSGTLQSFPFFWQIVENFPPVQAGRALSQEVLSHGAFSNLQHLAEKGPSFALCRFFRRVIPKIHIPPPTKSGEAGPYGSEDPSFPSCQAETRMGEHMAAAVAIRSEKNDPFAPGHPGKLLANSIRSLFQPADIFQTLPMWRRGEFLSNPAQSPFKNPCLWRW